jgi:hypothetical protein
VSALCIGAASHVWNSKLEPVFAKITNKLESVARGESNLEVNPGEKTLLPVRRE